MTKITGIYLVTATDGFYIGQSRDIKKRWSVLKSRKRPKELLYQSILKHGVESLEFKVLHELPFDITQECLDRHEKLYISQYKECGYNMFNKQIGGKWGGGNIIDESTRKQISEKLKGIKFSEQRKANIRKALKGKCHINSGSFKIGFGSKLTKEQADEIRSKYIPEIYSIRKIAREYKVDGKVIRGILSNTTICYK